MPDATTQLMVGLLFRCGVFFFSRGVREDVFGNLFSSKDLSGSKSRLKTKEGES
jgi:hypothetical protein